MEDNTLPFFELTAQNYKKVTCSFDGELMSSDGGLLLIKKLDEQLQLTQQLSLCFNDQREASRVRHSIHSMLSQRIFGIACGYEDLNDHDSLRLDPVFQYSSGSDEELASDSTLQRFEQTAEKSTLWDIHKTFVSNFIKSYKKAPASIVLDFDPTDDRVHGNQENKFYHGYYGHDCFLPLYVFCEDQLLVSYLRPARGDNAHHVGAVLRLLIKEIRKYWKKTTIIFRADSGLCRKPTMHWCEKNEIKYITGIIGNKRLQKINRDQLEYTRERYEALDETATTFTEYSYQADTWNCSRKIIAKNEVNTHRSSSRFLITNMDGSPKVLHEFYCGRGNMENRIKEQQLGLFADRTSCYRWRPNQLRVCLSAMAYILLERFRSIGLKGTPYNKYQVTTIRNKFIKIATCIKINTRRVYFSFNKNFAYQNTFYKAYLQLNST